MDFTTLAELSRIHCLAICAFLVPANLLATLTTMIFTARRAAVWQKALAIGVAAFLAVTMVLHVWTWFAIGVVKAPTFILLSLASLCLLINTAAVIAADRFVLAYRWLRRRLSQRWRWSVS